MLRLVAEELHAFGERINAAVLSVRLDAVADLRLSVSVSVGAALPGAGDTSWTGVYQRTDAAMYRAKQAGRDRTVLFNPDK